MMQKVNASHLERRAYVYVRQSTTAQVFHNTESTQRQYALAERAVALGWSRNSVEVVDEDLGRSGATADGRTGFSRIVHDVAHGKVGAVLAVEVSRLARSSEDWHRLMTLCAVAETVVIDESAVYDPGNTDDKLLLDIKGTMSEAELHWLGLRLVGACRSKARRGELRTPPPTGYVWTETGLELDPDETIQRAIRLVFERFQIEASAAAVVRWAKEAGLLFPTKRHYADGTCTLQWKPLTMSRTYELLRNPTFAGVYTYGRRPLQKRLEGGEIRTRRSPGRDPERWLVRIDGAHPAYISWETWVSNQKTLKANGVHFAAAGNGAPKGGSALLAGLVLCGRCGGRMDVHYGSANAAVPYYFCRGNADSTTRRSWITPAEPIDRAVEQVFLDAMVPAELELSLAVERQVDAQASALDAHWKLRIEQLEYDARRAERRYMAVDPDNRVVARTLEHNWEEALRALERARQDHLAARSEHRVQLGDEDRARVRALARDLPKVWKAASTPQSDRKAMLSRMIEAISLMPVDLPKRSTEIRIGWKTGAVTELAVPRPDRRERFRTPQGALERLRQLAADGVRDEQIAEQLNEEGFVTGQRKAWTQHAVVWARRHEGIARVAPHAPRGRTTAERDPAGRYSIPATAKKYGVRHGVVRRWVDKGWVPATKERESDGSRRCVWWLTIDAATDRRLGELARQSRARLAKSSTSD